MKKARAALSARYLARLRAHLARKKLDNDDHPQGLGRAALAVGLGAMDLSAIHQKALVALASSFDFSNPLKGSMNRAGGFLTQALVPLETVQRATRLANQLLRQRNETMRLHTAALAKANRRLAYQVQRRKTAEESSRKDKEEYEILFLQSQIMQKKLRHLTRQIISAHENERKEISRELHDEVVQTLVGINVQLSALGKGASVGLHALKIKIARTQRLVERSVKEVHRFARELRPAVLDDLGLIPALHGYAKDLAKRKNIKIHLSSCAGAEALGDTERTVLFRVAQEALTNVVRHANASLIRIVMRKLPDAICMNIVDNGKSFSVQKIFLHKNPKRLGLIGMKERLEMVGGSLAIKSTPGKGTTVRATIPLNPAKSIP